MSEHPKISVKNLTSITIRLSVFDKNCFQRRTGSSVTIPCSKQSRL